MKTSKFKNNPINVHMQESSLLSKVQMNWKAHVLPSANKTNYNWSFRLLQSRIAIVVIVIVIIHVLKLDQYYKKREWRYKLYIAK